MVEQKVGVAQRSSPQPGSREKKREGRPPYRTPRPTLSGLLSPTRVHLNLQVSEPSQIVSPAAPSAQTHQTPENNHISTTVGSDAVAERLPARL